MIDYEITVDVSDCNIETKKKVQDAFFKLGFTWRFGRGGAKYTCLDKGCYTNTFMTGKVSQDLTWVGVGHKEPTHTIRELLELAGMTDTTPFDLEKALAGEPVVLRNGNKAYVRHSEAEFKITYPLIGFVGEEGAVGIMRWMKDGRYYYDKVERGFDIVGMWHEPLVFEHWNLLAEGVKYLAKDRSGKWYGFYRKPHLHRDAWVGDKGWESTAILNPTLFPDCDWKTSLMERPEND